MKKPIVARERDRVIADELDLPLAVVRETIRRLKESGEISSRRPQPSQLSARELARTLIGLSAHRSVDVTSALSGTSDLLRTLGDGAVNAETELTDLIDEAAGKIDTDIAFTEGDVMIAPGRFVVVSGQTHDAKPFTRAYKRQAGHVGMTRVAVIPLTALRRIAARLIGGAA